MFRRNFVRACAGLAGVPALTRINAVAASARGKVKITDIKVMMLQGPRTYTLVKVLTDSGLYGIGEGYGSPAVGVKEGILELRPSFVGRDPLDFEALYMSLGNRVDGSAHMLLRAVTGIEVALWDLSGKILNVPVSTLLGGQVRDRVRMYTGEGPRDMLEKASCREWAAEMKASLAGWTAFKFGGPRSGGGPPPAGGRGAAGAPLGGARGSPGRGVVSQRQISRQELMDIRQGFENCREAIGWNRDLMFHGMWGYNLVSAIQLAEALEPAKVAWLEDPMPPDFSDAWVQLTATAKVPILTGENLGRRQEWVDFFFKKGFHIGQLDMRNTGGLLESKKISDLADVALIPMCAHNTGCIVNNFATVHWASTVRDFIAAETRIGNGDWMDDVILHDGPVIKDGHITVPDRPGLGIELNPDVVKTHLAAGETYWG